MLTTQCRVHPTQKPVALAEWCFEHYAKPGDSVLDLFGGSGSTLIACEKSGRRCFMMELSPAYCDVIIRRWEEYSGKKAILDGESQTT
jgi:DNA modification methylase